MEIPCATIGIVNRIVAKSKEKIPDISSDRRPSPLVSILNALSQLVYKGDIIDLVDEGTALPQKLVLRTVHAEYTELTEAPLRLLRSLR